MAPVAASSEGVAAPDDPTVEEIAPRSDLEAAESAEEACFGPPPRAWSFLFTDPPRGLPSDRTMIAVAIATASPRLARIPMPYRRPNRAGYEEELDSQWNALADLEERHLWFVKYLSASYTSLPKDVRVDFKSFRAKVCESWAWASRAHSLSSDLRGEVEALFALCRRVEAQQIEQARHIRLLYATDFLPDQVPSPTVGDNPNLVPTRRYVDLLRKVEGFEDSQTALRERHYQLKMTAEGTMAALSSLVERVGRLEETLSQRSEGQEKRSSPAPPSVSTCDAAVGPPLPDGRWPTWDRLVMSAPAGERRSPPSPETSVSSPSGSSTAAAPLRASAGSGVLQSTQPEGVLTHPTSSRAYADALLRAGPPVVGGRKNKKKNK